MALNEHSFSAKACHIGSCSRHENPKVQAVLEGLVHGFNNAVETLTHENHKGQDPFTQAVAKATGFKGSDGPSI